MPEKHAELADRDQCRRQLVDTRVSHRNQLRTTHASFAKQQQTSLIETLDDQIEKLDEEIAKLIDEDDDMRHLDQLLQSVIGVGAVLMMQALGKGATAYIEEAISGLGSNVLLVMPGAPRGGMGTYAGAPLFTPCLLYTSPSPRDRPRSRMPSSA